MVTGNPPVIDFPPHLIKKTARCFPVPHLDKAEQAGQRKHTALSYLLQAKSVLGPKRRCCLFQRQAQFILKAPGKLRILLWLALPQPLQPAPGVKAR